MRKLILLASLCILGLLLLVGYTGRPGGSGKQWTSPIADEATMLKLQYLQGIEGFPADAFKNTYWFSSYWGSDSNPCTEDAPCQTVAYAKYLCGEDESGNRCLFQSGEWWSPYVLTMSDDTPFYPGEVVDWDDGTNDAIVEDWVADPLGNAPGCVAAPCGILVVAANDPPGHTTPVDGDAGGAAPAAAGNIDAGSRVTGLVIDAVTNTLEYAKLHEGEATGGSDIYLIDGTAPFTPDALVGYVVYKYNSSNKQDWRTILANTNNTITTDTWDEATVSGDDYTVGFGQFQGTLNPECDDIDAPCMVFQSTYDTPGEQAHISCSWDDPSDPSRHGAMMAKDEKANPGGWVVVDGLLYHKCWHDIFSTGLSGNSDAGNILVVNGGGVDIFNDDDVGGGAANNQGLTTHTNGWLVGLNAESTSCQDSSGTAGSPVAPTGVGGMLLIGHKPIISKGDAGCADRGASVNNQVPISLTGGDVLIYGHPLRAIAGSGGTLLAVMNEGTDDTTLDPEGLPQGVDLTLVRTKFLPSGLPSTSASYTMLIPGSTPVVKADEYFRFKVFSSTLGFINTGGAGSCFNWTAGRLIAGTQERLFYARGMVLDECKITWRDQEDGQIDNYVIDFQKSAYDDNSAIEGVGFCNIESANQADQAACQAAFGSNHNFFNDADSINLNGKDAWQNDLMTHYTPNLNIHHESAAAGQSIGTYVIQFPNQQGGYVPKWVLGTGANITAMKLNLKMGGN